MFLYFDISISIGLVLKRLSPSSELNEVRIVGNHVLGALWLQRGLYMGLCANMKYTLEDTFLFYGSRQMVNWFGKYSACYQGKSLQLHAVPLPLQCTAEPAKWGHRGVYLYCGSGRTSPPRCLCCVLSRIIVLRVTEEGSSAWGYAIILMNLNLAKDLHLFYEGSLSIADHGEVV